MPAYISRRRCLQQLALTATAASFPRLLQAADVPSPDKAQTEAIAAIAKAFMEKYSVPGMAVAFTVNDQPAFSTGYGMADKDAGDKVGNGNLFRIASLAKPVTAVAILQFAEQGKLKLDDPVFGKDKWIPTGDLPDETLAKLQPVTIRHLLNHTCGGWGNDGSDPMFQHEEMGHKDLIAITLKEQPLKNAPGTNYSYSNFGYCLLGRIIEKISGKSYEEHVKAAVLKPCGITAMRIAGNTREERVKGEVIYYGSGERTYNMNVRRMDSHGGWLASAEDYAKFLAHTGKTGGLLKPETIATMATAPECHPEYACGWSVNKAGNLWHTGSLPGTSTIGVRTSSGLCWAAFTNNRSDGIGGALDRMMWDMAKAVPAWKA
jgi:CubicO group peptidase (beta-lactamase class C family)